MSNPDSTPALDLVEEAASVGAAVPGPPRKLVRPRLDEQAGRMRTHGSRQIPPLLAHQDLALAQSPSGGHAELFYFQKQIQAQTHMVFVLDDGERIEGVIEWYDLHVIKVRHATRTMIYKSSIKYMYKASEVAARGVMPK